MGNTSGQLMVKSDKNLIEGMILEFIKSYLSNETKGCQFKVRLVLSELLANSYFHGNKECTHKNIEIWFGIKDSVLTLKIKDEGVGFDLVESKGFVNHTYKESGRGLSIVQEIAEEFFTDETGRITVTLDFNKL